MTPRRALIVTATAVASVLPLWGLAQAGLLQVRACVTVPGMFGTAGGAHLMLLRPAPECPSGVALDEHGLLAVVGAVAVTTLLAHVAGIGVLAGVAALAVRAAGVVARLLERVLPGARRPGRAPAVVCLRGVTLATAFPPLARGVRTAVVALRAPPLAA
ncbi:hypothetical protein [Litorihabitans aurantiacus]|uniref:Uncharacterized protein n=1 Tax=Litorihabitans aurantiacus TaxID=1930061 RepID=A0AA37UUA2_9MICO|nr:hypothetical protein [Litorihabitans aurantiacus]GMA30336.1 hypothetical protein GCM10025875_03280 [Litorihabitans aurantiacus]